MTAKEKLLERAPHWSEEQAERALRAAEGDVDEWGICAPDTGARRAGRAAAERARAGRRRQLVSGPARERSGGARRSLTGGARDEAIERLNQVIVVPLTTPIRGLANEVEIDVADGLPRTCVTSFDNPSTIARGQLVEKIATLEPARMDEICRALNATVARRGG